MQSRAIQFLEALLAEHQTGSKLVSNEVLHQFQVELWNIASDYYSVGKLPLTITNT